MRLAAGPCAGMAGMLVTFIDHVEGLWIERRTEFGGDGLLHRHEVFP